MPYNGSGTFTQLYDWNQDATNGINISSSRMQAEAADIASGLSNAITRDGQGIPTAAIPWGGNDLTGVGNFTAASATISGALTLTGALANGSKITDGSTNNQLIGYRNIPFTTARTANYTIALTDVGMCIPISGGAYTITIPLNATTAFNIGDCFSVYNANTSTAITIAIATGGTLRLGNSSTTGARTLAARGFVIVMKVNTDEWVCLNGGIS